MYPPLVLVGALAQRLHEQHFRGAPCARQVVVASQAYHGVALHDKDGERVDASLSPTGFNAVPAYAGPVLCGPVSGGMQIHRIGKD